MTEPTSEKRVAKPISTDRGCATAKPAEDGSRIDYMIDGAPGLRLRVSRDRRGQISRKWSLLYTSRDEGRKARLVLGEYPAVSLKDARSAALQHRGKIVGGADPAADMRRDKEAETFEELANLWLERHAKVKKRSWRNDQYMIKAEFLPKLGKLKANKVTKRHIIDVVDGIMDRGSPYQANRVLVLAKTIFKWGMKRDIVATNPAALLDKPSGEEKRKRVLSAAEFKLFWRGLNQAPMTEALQLCLKLALLTGQRINEIGLARKIEFDFTNHVWIVPGRRQMPNDRKESGQKNKVDHHLPLTAEIEALLQQAIELSGESEWLFPSGPTRMERRSNSQGPIGETAISRAYRRARQTLGLPDTRPHDLRRTWSTIAGDLGYEDFEIGLVLNHKTSRGPITGSIYNQSRYMDQKRRIIERVQECILAAM
jgi:integrase